MEPLPARDVRLDDDFWAPRLRTNRTTTIPWCLRHCEMTGRIDNFAKAAGLLEGAHAGQRYDDSDVFKVIEGAAHALACDPDPALERSIDAVIEKVAAAQEPDGYLFTARTIDPENPPAGCGASRWSALAHSHELYNAGHLYEAAVAHFRATGSRTLLDVALRNADLVDREFGPGRRRDPPGHEEIEIGLVKLYAVTGERRYLDLAGFFLECRGRAEGRELYGDYAQDHLPVVRQDEPVGHAVRAMYLYCAMAEVAALTGAPGYDEALRRIWENMISTRLYLTGGIGARQSGESFGEPWELPNQTAYCETCAAIGNALWNHRMALLHRDARYADVLERVLYNGFLSGVALSGDRFFYPNPLASAGTCHRSPWFSCACCPVNVARFMPGVPGLMYAQGPGELAVNLYAAGTASIRLAAGELSLRQETRYPWDGLITIRLDPDRRMRFALLLRVPGWAVGRPVPGSLYRYAAPPKAPGCSVRLNGRALEVPRGDDGYLRLERTWSPGDVVALHLDMEPRLVRADDRVEANRGRHAIERGPIVYCLEAADNGAAVRDLWLPADGRLSCEHRPDLLGGVTVVRAEGSRVCLGDQAAGTHSRPALLTAIPYYAWDHRGPGEMTVWVPASADLARPVRPATAGGASRESASHCWPGDSVAALRDGLEPASSGDHSIPRMTWWDHLGTVEWAQYDFAEPRWVSGSAVYWFDDTGEGRCRVPGSWRLLYREAGTWKPVAAPSGYALERDRFNEVSFDPVLTTGLRLEATLRPGFSGGILEWRVE
jgi:hypothetical protein